MWILSITPDWVFHVMLIAGILGTIAGFALGFISVIKQYIIPIRIISIVLLLFGLFMEGALLDNQQWQLRVKEVEAKLAKAEAQSQKENIKVVEKVVKKTEYYRVRGNDIVQYVDREVSKYDSQCVIPKEFIKAHNDAAEKQK